MKAQLDESYWNAFYAQWQPMPPSQFAALVATELPPRALVLDIGCGNGRDSFFFGDMGFPTVGFDKSSVAIESNNQRTRHEHVRFLCTDVADASFADAVTGHQVVCAYARFFLHAITEDVQAQLFASLRTALPRGALVCLEYRTLRDRQTEKIFGEHYRRYIDHARLLDDLRELGITIEYEIESRGMARFRDEDPYVGRVLARR